MLCDNVVEIGKCKCVHRVPTKKLTGLYATFLGWIEPLTQLLKSLLEHLHLRLGVNAPQLNHYYDNINNQLNFISRKVKGPSISQLQKSFLGIMTNICPILADLVEMWSLEKKVWNQLFLRGREILEFQYHRQYDSCSFFLFF